MRVCGGAGKPTPDADTPFDPSPRTELRRRHGAKGWRAAARRASRRTPELDRLGGRRNVQHPQRLRHHNIGPSPEPKEYAPLTGWPVGASVQEVGDNFKRRSDSVHTASSTESAGDTVATSLVQVSREEHISGVLALGDGAHDDVAVSHDPAQMTLGSRALPDVPFLHDACGVRGGVGRPEGDRAVGHHVRNGHGRWSLLHRR